MTYVKKTAAAVFSFLLLLLTLILPRQSAAGVWQGAVTACTAALPSLFPALVLAKLLASSRLPGGRFLPLFLGLVCGFPVGAVTVSEMVSQGAVDQKCGNRLLFCCCNTGPAFIIGYCGAVVLRNVRAGILLYGMECSVALILYLLLVPNQKSDWRKERSLSLSDAITSAVKSFLTIAGCVIFFSCISTLLLTVIPLHGNLEQALIRTALEITGGMADASRLPFSAAFSLCAAGVGWAGVSVCLQSAGPIRNSGLSLRWYLAGRCAFALILFLLSLFAKKLL